MNSSKLLKELLALTLTDSTQSYKALTYKNMKIATEKSYLSKACRWLDPEQRKKKKVKDVK